jgi:undecaprenyl diphosphate synthase
LKNSNPQSPIPNLLPNHVGLIMDGNRRWAKENGKTVNSSHKKGSEVFKDISIGLFDRGINFVSTFIFSKENWQRKVEEVDYLMRLVIKAVEVHLDEYDQKNIRIKILGEKDNLSKKVLKAIERTEERTANNDGGTLALCFNYGGRQELVDATKRIIESGVSSDEITEITIQDNLYSPEIPDVDLLIRSSGEQRISGFMLWRVSYAELAFTDVYWPDITMGKVNTIIDEYSNRQRRFGC